MGWVFFLPLGIGVVLLGSLVRKYWYFPSKALVVVLILSLLPIIYLLLVSKLIKGTSYEATFDLTITETLYPFMYLAFIGGIVSLVSLSVYGVTTLLKKGTT